MPSGPLPAAGDPLDPAAAGLPIVDFGSRFLRLAEPRQRGTDVKILQFKLKVCDRFDPGPIDGVFGPRTDQAVRDFQAYYRLAVDGVAGPDTFWCLGESTGPYLGGSPRFGSRVLRQGMRGGDVWILQDRLNVAGETGLGVASGVFDQATAASVRGFQARYGLVPDGVVGRLTVYELKLRTWFGGRQLAAGTKGCDVRQLQRWLNSIAHAPVLAEDGFFGPKTAAQVRAYQASVGIGADGVVGPVTLHSLGCAVDGIGLDHEGRIFFRRQDPDTGRWSVRSLVVGQGKVDLTGELGVEPYDPVASPDGQWVAYVADDDRLYLVPSGGGTPQALTDGVAFPQEVAWSPDSTTLAVVKGAGDVYLVNRATGAATFLVAGSFPSWFPVGARLAFAGAQGEALALQAIDADGTGLTTITTQNPPYHVIKVSPDGSRILYTTPGASVSIVMIVDVATGAVTELPSGPLAKDYCPVWSPNGRLIAYSATDFNDRLKYFGRLRIADDAGKVLLDVVLSTCFEACRITWGPHSDRLAYVSGCIQDDESTEDVFSAPLFAAFAPDISEQRRSDQPYWIQGT